MYSTEDNGASQDAVYNSTTGTLKLRAELDLTSMADRPYLVVVKVTDAAGNATYWAGRVGMPRYQNKPRRSAVDTLGKNAVIDYMTAPQSFWSSTAITFTFWGRTFFRIL